MACGVVVVVGEAVSRPMAGRKADPAFKAISAL